MPSSERFLQYVFSKSCDSLLTTLGQCVPGTDTSKPGSTKSSTSTTSVKPSTTLVTTTKSTPISTSTSASPPSSTGIEYLISLYVKTRPNHSYSADFKNQRRQLLANRFRSNSQPGITVQPSWQSNFPGLDHLWRPKLDRLLHHAIQLQSCILVQLRKRRCNY